MIDEGVGAASRLHWNQALRDGRMILHPKIQLPSLVSDDNTLQSTKDLYTKLAHEMVTEKGIWDPNTGMYVYGRKPDV